MLSENVIYIGFILNIIGGLSYLLDTISGKTKPNKVTWFLWALAPFIAFAAQVKDGVGLVALMTFAVGLNPFLIFLASFVNKKSKWKITSFDLFCGALSLVGLVLWYITKTGNIAIFFSILSGFIAGIPTLIKAFHSPETENANVFIYGAINALLTLLTIKIWDFAHAAFPIYIFLMCVMFMTLVKFKLGKRLSKIYRK